MVTVVNSKNAPLPASTVISTALTELPLPKGVTPEVAMLSLAQEINMPDADMVQVGNTVFIGHRGKGGDEDLMWGRALNIDTAQNFISNGLRYFTHLQSRGIKRFYTAYEEKIYDSAFLVWDRFAKKGDSEITIQHLKDNSSKVYIILGEIPLSEVT